MKKIKTQTRSHVFTNRSVLYRNLLLAGVIGLFLYIIVVSFFQYREYRQIESKLHHTYDRPISDAIANTEYLYKLFGETDMVFRMFTLEFDDGSYLLYRNKLDSIGLFIDSLSTIQIEGNPLMSDADSNFGLRNRYATEFAVLRKTLDELIFNNESEDNPITSVRQTGSRGQTINPDTMRSRQTQDVIDPAATDTVVRRRESLFRRIFQAKNDTIVINNERRNQLETERMEITQGSVAGDALPMTGMGAGNMQAIQSTFRQLQEKEKQLILTNYDLLDQLKSGIDALRLLELASIRQAESADFNTYQANFRVFRIQLIFALVLLLVLIVLLIFYQRRASKWERQLVEEVAYSNQLAREKTHVLTKVTHEVRTPLNALLNIADILKQQDGNPIDQEQLDLTKSAYYNISMINSTITDILNISKLEEDEDSKEAGQSISLDFFSPGEILDQVITLHKNQSVLKQQELISKNTLDPRLHVYSDQYRVGQILSNLISNAIKYSDQGGKITITTSISKEKNQEFLRIEVQDMGIGMKDEQLNQVFRKYYTASPTKGFGLGLYLAKRSVEELGGTIGAKSKLGEGSTFYFTVPIDKTEMRKSMEVSSMSMESLALPADQLSVLIVEDNPINLLYMKKILKKGGLNIFEAMHVRSAQEILSREQVDIVITDVHLPELSGWDLLRYIRSSDVLCHIKVYSSTASLDSYTSDGELSFDGQLNKPFAEKDLVRLIRGFMGAQ